MEYEATGLDSWSIDEARTSSANLAERERWLSLVSGGLLVLSGLSHKGIGRLLMGALGGALVYQGITGNSPVYRLLGVNPAVQNDPERVSVPQEQGIHVRKTVTINRPVEELYSFWRNLENLPRFMNHLEAVTVQEVGRSHWKAKAPAGMSVEWDAEIVSEVPNEVIAWRSLANAQVANAGSVRFKAAPGGRGTELKVELEYVPPAGKLGATVAKLFGEAPDQQISDDLRRFKQLMEAGEVATTEGQSSGRRQKEQMS